MIHVTTGHNDTSTVQSEGTTCFESDPIIATSDDGHFAGQVSAMQYLQRCTGRVKHLTDIVRILVHFHSKSQSGIRVCRLFVYVTDE